MALTSIKGGKVAKPASAPAESVAAAELTGIYLFAGFDEAQRQVMARATRRVALAEGERLFDMGQPVERFFYLRRGQVKLFRLSAEGDEKVIEIVRPGQTFAEAAMFMEARQGYPVSAEAIVPSELLAFESGVMLDLLRQSTGACFKLMAAMSQRLRKQINEVDRLTLHNATYRLVTYLLQQVPEGVMESPEVQLTTPKNVIASRLSIKPETFSRILARLARQGLIETHGANIVLRDVAGLRALVAE